MTTPDMDPIEAALLAGGDEQPSPLFTARVMSAVRREAAAPPPLRFPWARSVAGLAAVLLWSALAWWVVEVTEPAVLLALVRDPLVIVGLAVLVGLASLRLSRFCADA